MRMVDTEFVLHVADKEFSEEDAGKVRWLISHIPSVVLNGKWQWVEDSIDLDLWRCSVCNITSMNASPYCPHCGAKMDWESSLRQVDDLGRVYIPKDYRQKLGIAHGDAIVVTVKDESGEIILKKRKVVEE